MTFHRCRASYSQLVAKKCHRNETLFFELDDARAKIANWVADYNLQRPHSSLRYLTPAAYAAHLTATDDRLRNPDQLRRSSVAPTAPLGVQNPEALTAAG